MKDWDSRLAPTRENIIRAMKWLVRGARKDDSLFLHCKSLYPNRPSSIFFKNVIKDSGHGGQTRDLDGDEIDGRDEGKGLVQEFVFLTHFELVIYPVDFRTAGFIVDDDLHDILVKPLPAGCRLTVGLSFRSPNRRLGSRFSRVSLTLVTRELSLISLTYILLMGD